MKLDREERSFTIIELLVVIAIIGLISSLALLTMDLPAQRQKTKITKTLDFSHSIQNSLGAEAVGIWNFDDCTATDLSGWKNNGTINGAACSSDTPQKIIGQGQGKNALNFNGTAYISVPNSVSLNINNLLTIEVWIKPIDLSSRHGIFTTRTTNAVGSFQLEVGTGSAGTNRAAITTPGVWNAETADNTVSLNLWQHIAYVRNGAGAGGQKIYINGTLQVLITDNPQTFIDNTDPKEIGRGTAGGSFSNGLIDEVRVYNQALTTGQIQKHYAEGLVRHQYVKK